MIKDAKGRCKNLRQSSGEFATKALAEDDARRIIQGHDAFAQAKEYSRRRACEAPRVN